MAIEKIEMYAKKQYELEEIKAKILTEFDHLKFQVIPLQTEVLRELGDTRTLLLIFENGSINARCSTSLVILLSEFRGYQSADIVAADGRDDFVSSPIESSFALFGETALKNIGFRGKYD